METIKNAVDGAKSMAGYGTAHDATTTGDTTATTQDTGTSSTTAGADTTTTDTSGDTGTTAAAQQQKDNTAAPTSTHPDDKGTGRQKASGSAHADDDKQHASEEGEDPNLTGPADLAKVKMTGTGAPGSHSALFGLTPSGEKSKDVDYSGTKPPSGDTEGSKEEKREETQGEGTGGDTSSRAPTGAGVKDQMNDPRVDESAAPNP